jgi:hypothetical protein
MKENVIAAVLIFTGSLSVLSAQNHGGGHSGGGHSGGGHASGGGHSSRGHAGGGSHGGGSATGAHGHSTGSTGTVGRSLGWSGAAGARAGVMSTGRSKSAATGQLAEGVPPYSRPRDPETPIIGIAVPRSPIAPTSALVSTVLLPAGRSYGFGYYPFGVGLGAYTVGYDDPFYGGAPTFTQAIVASDEGALRLKIKPRNADVFVDGNYVGVVDDFDGLFQKLHVSGGVHRIEVRAAGYETLVFDARISPDHKTTYEGELKRIP